MTKCVMFVIAIVAAFGIGCYLIGITVTKNLKRMLHIADKRIKLKRGRSLAMERFTDLIKWHVLVKQLSELKKLTI